MPTFTNRTTKSVIISRLLYSDDGELVHLFTSKGAEYTVPRTYGTDKIYEDPDDFYTLEFDTLTNMLTGIYLPSSSVAYRIDDRQVKVLAHSSNAQSQTQTLVKDDIRLTKELPELIETMMNLLHPNLLQRLRNLPEDYLETNYIYEVKVSYLASPSSPDTASLFDPTNQELAHALVLAQTLDPNYPPLLSVT